MSHQPQDARAARTIRHFGEPPFSWVRETDTDHDVLIVGGGQAGIGIGFALRRAGIQRFSVIDSAAPGQTGVWTTIARMRTLRTPKAWPEPEFGFPELSFRAWHEEQYGEQAYAELGRIPRLVWADYIAWIEDAFAIPVRHRTRLVDLRPSADPTDEHLVAHLEITGEDGRVELHSQRVRKVILANGVEGTGGAQLPQGFSELPSTHGAHTGDSIDFPALAGKRVAVVGAGASALDAASTALEAGAAEVHLFTRRDQLIIQGPKGFGPQSLGARENFHRRSDADRWKQKHTAARAGRSCTLESVERAAAHDGFRVHLSAGWNNVAVDGDRVKVDAADGVHHFDFVIAGTGYQYDPNTRPDLAGVASHIALWSDRYTPPAELGDEGLARWPYLGDGYEFVEKVPGQAPWVGRIHAFNAGAALSFGLPVGDTQSLPTGIPRLVDAIGRDLYLEDIAKPAPAAPATPATTPAAPTPFRETYAHTVWTD